MRTWLSPSKYEESVLCVSDCGCVLRGCLSMSEYNEIVSLSVSMNVKNEV